MSTSKIRSISLFSLILLIIFSSATSKSVRAQVSDPQLERGITHYKNQEYFLAEKLFRSAVKHRKDDLIAWHYLGLTLKDLNKKGDARKAHEKSAKLGESLLVTALKNTSTEDPLAPLLPLSGSMSYAASSAREYIALSPKLAGLDLEDWTNRAISLEDYAEILKEYRADQKGKKVFTGKQVTSKPRITAKPEPMYTERARKSRVTGTVVLRALLAADGTVRNMVVLKGLSRGLTGRAIDAARQIRFIPAKLEGKSVSMFIQLEYNFNLY